MSKSKTKPKAKTQVTLEELKSSLDKLQQQLTDKGFKLKITKSEMSKFHTIEISSIDVSKELYFVKHLDSLDMKQIETICQTITSM